MISDLISRHKPILAHRLIPFFVVTISLSGFLVTGQGSAKATGAGSLTIFGSIWFPDFPCDEENCSGSINQAQILGSMSGTENGVDWNAHFWGFMDASFFYSEPELAAGCGGPVGTAGGYGWFEGWTIGDSYYGDEPFGDLIFEFTFEWTRLGSTLLLDLSATMTRASSGTVVLENRRFSTKGNGGVMSAPPLCDGGTFMLAAELAPVDHHEEVIDSVETCTEQENILDGLSGCAQISSLRILNFLISTKNQESEGLDGEEDDHYWNCTVEGSFEARPYDKYQGWYATGDAECDDSVPTMGVSIQWWDPEVNEPIDNEEGGECLGTPLVHDPPVENTIGRVLDIVENRDRLLCFNYYQPSHRKRHPNYVGVVEGGRAKFVLNEIRFHITVPWDHRITGVTPTATDDENTCDGPDLCRCTYSSFDQNTVQCHMFDLVAYQPK